MKLVSIDDILKSKGDVPLYYRNEYDAVARFSTFEGKEAAIPLYFLVETLPTGEKNVEVKLKESIDYPLLPILKSLKQEILQLDKRGDLL